MRNILVLIGIALLASSCGKQPIVQYFNVPDRIWAFQKPVDFVVNIAKPGYYQTQVRVRYTQEYSYSNIWVVLDEKRPDGKKAGMRFNIPLFDLSGSPFGSFAGKFYDRNYPDSSVEGKPLILNFPLAGQYTFSIQHNMRIDKLDGIAEIGIKLKEQK